MLCAFVVKFFLHTILGQCFFLKQKKLPLNLRFGLVGFLQKSYFRDPIPITMKCYVQNLAMLSAVIAFGCQSNKTEIHPEEVKTPAVSAKGTSDAQTTAAKETQTIDGLVKETNHGKDGYTAKIETNDGKIFYATVSRANLKDAKQYRDFNANEIVKLTGEVWRLEGKDQLTVREIN